MNDGSVQRALTSRGPSAATRTNRPSSATWSASSIGASSQRSGACASTGHQVPRIAERHAGSGPRQMASSHDVWTSPTVSSVTV
jgi:hypothetical protein